MNHSDQAKTQGPRLSSEALASEAEVTIELITELTRIGVLRPTSPVTADQPSGRD